MTASENTRICVAAIAGAFGVKGEVKLKPFTDDPVACLSYGPLLDEGGRIVLTVTRSRLVKNAVAVIAEEVTTREQAEALKSTQLFVPRTALPEPDADDFYYADLIGLDVKSTDGKRIGEIIAVHEFGAGDMLEIKPKEEASFFHPFTKNTVPKVDIGSRRVVIKLDDLESVDT